jgi:glycerol-3-phosphate dehydrogenase
MPQTIEDILARRTHALFLNTKAAIEIAPQIAKIMADELNKDEFWIDAQIKQFKEIARNYMVKSN